MLLLQMILFQREIIFKMNNFVKNTNKTSDVKYDRTNNKHSRQQSLKWNAGNSIFIESYVD